MPLESLYSQTKNLCVSLGLPTVDPFVDLYLVSKADTLLRDVLNSWSGLSRSRFVRLIHLLEEMPTYDTVKAWRQLLKSIVWKQCKHLLISPTIQTKVLQNIDLIAQKCKELGDQFPTYVVSRDLDEHPPTPLLDVATYVKTLDWQNCLEVEECILTYLLDLHNTYSLVDLRRGVIGLVIRTLEDYADKCIGNIDFLFITYILSRFYRFKRDICKLLVQPTSLDNLLWEATWNPSFEASSGDLVNVLREAIYETVINYYIKENCTWLFVGGIPAFVSHYLVNHPEDELKYISLMNFAYSGCLLIAKDYLEFLGSQLSPLLTTSFSSYPELENYLRSINIQYNISPSVFDEIVALWTSPKTIYKFTGGDESWSTLMLLIYNEVLKPLKQTSELVDIDCLFTLLSTLSTFVGSGDDWKDVIRFFIECCYWDGEEAKYEALTTSLWMYLSGKLEMRVQTNEYNSLWLTIWREFVYKCLEKFSTNVMGEIYNRLRELYNVVFTSYKNAKNILPQFYKSITTNIISTTASHLQRALESMLWDVDVPTLMSNIKSYIMYNSITLSPSQQQKLLSIMSVVINKRLYDDRESLEALTNDRILTDVLIGVAPTLESYSEYIQDLKQQVVKKAVADLSSTLEHQVNNTQSELHQSLNNTVTSSYSTLKNARDSLYIDPWDVSAYQKYEQTKTRILRDCVSNVCTNLTPILQNHFSPSSLQQYSGGQVASTSMFGGSSRFVNSIVKSTTSPSSIKSYSLAIDNSFLRDVASKSVNTYSRINSSIYNIFRVPNAVIATVGGALGSISTLINTAVNFTTLPLSVVRNVTSLVLGALGMVSNVERMIDNIVGLPTTALNNVQRAINGVQSLVSNVGGLESDLFVGFDRLKGPVGSLQSSIQNVLPITPEVSLPPSEQLSSILQSFADCPSCFLGGDPPHDEKLQQVLDNFAKSRSTGSHTDNEYAYNAELLG